MTILDQIGFTKSEVNVYEALLELGTSTAGPVAEKARTSSSKIYEILERLIQKGLVSYVLKGKVKYFEAASPERIMDYLEEKENTLSKQKEEVKKILPTLKLKQTLAEHKQEATIYRGMKGLETAFYSSMKRLKKGDEFCVTGVPGRSDATNLFFLRLNKLRAKLGIKMKILFDESARGDIQTKPENSPLSEIKFLPEEVMTPAAINIFKDEVIIFPAETQKEPLLITIKSKEVADSFKAQFDILWNQQVRIYTGPNGPRKVLREMTQTISPVYAFGINEPLFDKYASKEKEAMIKHLDKHQLTDNIIFSERVKTSQLAKKANVRVLPKEYFSPLHVEMFGDKVAVIDWTEPITTIIFEKKGIVNGYKKYFELLWKVAKK